MSEILEGVGLLTVTWLIVIIIIGLCFWIKDFILEHRIAYNKGYKEGCKDSVNNMCSCVGCSYDNSSLCYNCRRNYNDMYRVIVDESNSC